MNEARPLILVVDDIARARESMRALFESIGCSVIIAGTYESAIADISSRSDIDFVVTDLNLQKDLPGDKSGVAFAKIVRQLRPNISVAAYSSRKDLDLQASDYRAFDIFLDKASQSAEKTREFATQCKAAAVANREMRGIISKQFGISTDFAPEITEVRASITRLEARINSLSSEFISKESIKGWLRMAYVAFGIMAGIASIVGLYYAIR